MSSLPGGLSEVRIEGETLIADAGVGLNALCRMAQNESLTGLEFAYGIPGTVGGGVFMNAGAYGGEIRDVCLWVEYLDEEGNVHKLSRNELAFDYRKSIFSSHPEWCILRAAFELKKGRAKAIEEKMEELIGRRKEKQPLEYPSAGSVFKRPEGYYAAALIDECGLKGRSVGAAQVSEKHAGFIINKGGATCRDVLSLIKEIQETVLREKGVMLECEIKEL